MIDRTWLVAAVAIAGLLAVASVTSSQLGATDCDAVVAAGESIQIAIYAADVGDVICVETGVFEEALVVPTDGLTLTAAQGEVPVLDGSSTTGQGIFVDEADDVRIERLHIRGHASEGIEVEEGASPQIVGNVIETNGRHGILAEGAPEAVVTDNVVTGNGRASGFANDGIALHHDAGVHPVDATIARNTIVANEGAGIELFHADRVVIEDNTVAVNAGGGIEMDDSPSALVLGNHAVANGYSGISVNGADIQVQDNTAVGNKYSGVEVYYAEQAEVAGNELAANTIGVKVHGDSPDAKLHDNSIAENDEGVNASDLHAGFVVDARWNWWGSMDGPSGGAEDPHTGESADGSGDSVSERVRFDPWHDTPPLLEPGPPSSLASVT